MSFNLILSIRMPALRSRYVGKTLQRFGERVKQHVPTLLVIPTDGTENKQGRPPKEREECRRITVSNSLSFGCGCCVLCPLFGL